MPDARLQRTRDAYPPEDSDARVKRIIIAAVSDPEWQALQRYETRIWASPAEPSDDDLWGV